MITVIKPRGNVVERGIWSDWLFGKEQYAKHNGTMLQKPLGISETNVTDDHVKVKLEHWSPKTFAIVTTNTFIASEDECLYGNAAQRMTPFFFPSAYGVDSTGSLFLNDKLISEEYQYILNRSKAEKWVGSSLTKPSVLIYPKVKKKN